MKAQRKLSAEEIERQLIDDARSPDAWGPAIRVGPSRTPRPSRYRQTIEADRREKVRQHHARVPMSDRDRGLQAFLRKRLHDAIAELPESQRQSVQLWLDGFKYREISNVLGISPEAVKSRLRDAKNHLRSRLDDSEFGTRGAGAKH
ncbi:MAG TPA: sigma-70 family RNA polymerase sigma factor [Thermoanaerobaculia bacterium]|nr:sigma-70 family RNA polymerase sigma factor [Thermoanaerobaculia bacterium]